MRVIYQECGEKARIQKTNRISTSCSDPECGHTFVMNDHLHGLYLIAIKLALIVCNHQSHQIHTDLCPALKFGT
ncbi:transcriptional regulator [Vibrio sagamiensis]|uniref:transcriptional regulator n=1 Tax=Vibrio sagamiensis TaxID=512650 RepID=UPI00353106AC